MSSPRITYTPRPDATPEGEIAALANVYRYIVDCRARKKGGPETAPDDAKGSKHDRAFPDYTGT